MCLFFRDLVMRKICFYITKNHMFCCYSCDLVLLGSAQGYFNEGNAILKKWGQKEGLRLELGYLPW